MLAPPDYSLLVIMLCFWLIYLVVRTQLVKPLGMVLDERERRVRQARAELTAAQESFSEAMANCERELQLAAVEAQGSRQSLRAAGEAARRAAVDGARSRGHERLRVLQSELDAATAEARAMLRQRGAALAAELASRLVGRKVAS